MFILFISVDTPQIVSMIALKSTFNQMNCYNNDNGQYYTRYI